MKPYTEARASLASPYARENAASLRRKASKPKNLLGWFLTGFRAEIPERIHGAGVFVGRPPKRDEAFASIDPESGRILSTAAELSGGSLLGTPRSNDAFRAYIEGDPTEMEMARLTEGGVTVEDWAYRMPMRAALAALAGRGRDTDPYPFMARTLFRTACMEGDWDAACRSMGITPPVRWAYMETALERLWLRYLDEPPARLYYQRSEVVA